MAIAISMRSSISCTRCFYEGTYTSNMIRDNNGVLN